TTVGQGNGPGRVEITAPHLATPAVAARQENGIGVQTDGQSFRPTDHCPQFAVPAHLDRPLPSRYFSHVFFGRSAAAVRYLLNDGLLRLGDTLPLPEGKTTHADFAVGDGGRYRAGALQHSRCNRRPIVKNMACDGEIKRDTLPLMPRHAR